jgi:hypothetical protein
VRIHPIRDLNEGLLVSPLDHPGVDFKEFACRPNWIACEHLPCKPARKGCRSAEPNINQVLLRRALAGVLTRLRSFDWQVIHGHNVGDSGKSLDVRA